MRNLQKQNDPALYLERSQMTIRWRSYMNMSIYICIYLYAYIATNLHYISNVYRNFDSEVDLV